MIILAILGILAAIAVPNFVEMQYRAKRAEVPGNVDGIKTAEFGYDATFDRHMPAARYPAGQPSGVNPVAWGTGNEGFNALGWAPDGDVRGVYEVTTNGSGDFTVRGMIDADGDGVYAVYTATKSINTVFLNNEDTY